MFWESRARVARRARNSVNGLARDKRGTGAIEFAFIVPVMITFFFGTLEGAELMIVDRRITTTANTLADLVAQARDNNDLARISETDLDLLIDNVAETLQVPDLNDVEVNVVSVVRDPDDDTKAIVHWSRDKDGGEPYTALDEYGGLDDVTRVHPSSSLIVVEFTYTYDQTVTEMIFDRPFTFTAQSTRWPRIGFHVQLCADTDDDDTCSQTPSAS